MFEDSTFESGNRIKSKSNYWMIFTFFLCSSVILVMILIPLIYPEALPRAAMTTLLVAPPPAAHHHHHHRHLRLFSTSR